MKELIKKILKEEIEKNDLIVPRRLEDRSERYKRIAYKWIQDYIKNGSKGDLNLNNSPIESLPSNLKTVGGSLILGDSKILELPSGLKVGGDLQISYTQISSLPSDLKVGGSLDLRKTLIKNLPSGLIITNSLDLDSTKILELPDDLTVGSILDIRNTEISEIPDRLRIGAKLIIYNTPLCRKYTERQIKQIIEDKGGHIKGKIWCN